MQTSATVLLSLFASVSAAVAVTLSLRAGETAVDGAAVGELRQVVARLSEENSTLRQRLDALADAPVPAVVPAAGERTAAVTVTAEQVAAAVEGYLRQRGDASGPADAAGPAKPAFDLETDFAALVGSNYWENVAAWKKAFQSGRMDDVVARFEALAKQDPKNVAKQMDLANAYLAYLQFDQTKWQLSMKADAVFDRVLDLDENHWQARFTKAVSYTFWPDFLGKKQEAIQHFETLVQQQDALPVENHHAETYLYLGNLIEAKDPQRAREIWRKGARRHPNNQELQKRAGS